MGKRIIGLVGEKGGGKGTVAAYLREKHGAAVHRFSAPMKDCLDRLGLPATRENLIAFSELTRRAYGEDLYARVIARDSAGDEAGLVVVDGIRREADIAALKNLPGFLLVYVTAPLETRWERARKRGEKPEETEMSLERFMSEESAPTELDIAALGAKADATLDNSGTFEELYRQIEGLIMA